MSWHSCTPAHPIQFLSLRVRLTNIDTAIVDMLVEKKTTRPQYFPSEDSSSGKNVTMSHIDASSSLGPDSFCDPYPIFSNHRFTNILRYTLLPTATIFKDYLKISQDSRTKHARPYVI